jgi:hypothetical protein
MLFATFITLLMQAVPHSNILVMGDSLACGSKWRIGEVKLPTESIQTECKVSSPIEFWSEKGAGKRALDAHPETNEVIIFLGTNNYYSTSVPDVEPLLREVRHRSLKCTWVGPTAVRGKKTALNPLLKAAVEKQCKYVDAEDIPLGDGIHPTMDGWLTLLKKIWSVR